MQRYLAYGSNLCTQQMAHRCPAAQAGEVVSLPGWRFIINNRGVATILPDPAARVLGLIWHLTPDCERVLDHYEGVDIGLYRRVDLMAGHGLALVYLAADTNPGAPRPRYLEGILSAAEALSFDPSYRSELAAWRRRAA